MSIASRITSIEGHISDIYDSVELTGVDTIDIDKNLVNVPNTLKEGYIDIINNGTDTLYNNFPKVSSEGTSLTLKNTYQAPMRNLPKGNTSQTGTPTSTSPIPVNVVSGDNTITISNQSGTDSNTYNIDLPSGMELCKIGNYQDYFYKDSDKWYLHKEIGKVVFTGGDNETWYISETSTLGSNRFLNGSIANLVTKPSADSVTINTLSNYFIAKSANQTYSNQEGLDISRNGNIHVYADSTKTYTVAQFKTWLSTHNLSVYYPLATPTSTEIIDTTLINQLEELYIAKSKENQTNISQVNNDLPFIISASALKKG
jgi:hypothetical protein